MWHLAFLTSLSDERSCGSCVALDYISLPHVFAFNILALQSLAFLLELGKHVSGFFCPLLPTKWKISLENELVFSLCPLLLVICLEPECRISLIHMNIVLSHVGFKHISYCYSREYFPWKAFNPFALE